MGVRVDDCRDRLVADMLTNHLHALPCRFDSGHTVDDDQSLVTLYDRQVRDVVVPHLIEAIRHLVKPTSAYDLTLAPQAGVDSVGCGDVVTDVRQSVRVEDHMPVVAENVARQTERSTLDPRRQKSCRSSMAYRATASRFAVTVAGVASLGVWHMALPARIRRSDTPSSVSVGRALGITRAG